MKEGYKSSVLHKYKGLIQDYIMEFGSRGVFDQDEEDRKVDFDAGVGSSGTQPRSSSEKAGDADDNAEDGRDSGMVSQRSITGLPTTSFSTQPSPQERQSSQDLIPEIVDEARYSSQESSVAMDKGKQPAHPRFEERPTSSANSSVDEDEEDESSSIGTVEPDEKEYENLPRGPDPTKLLGHNLTLNDEVFVAQEASAGNETTTEPSSMINEVTNKGQVPDNAEHSGVTSSSNTQVLYFKDALRRNFRFPFDMVKTIQVRSSFVESIIY